MIVVVFAYTMAWLAVVAVASFVSTQAGSTIAGLAALFVLIPVLALELTRGHRR